MAAAELRPGERVLEIGPGEGVLTTRLSQAVGPEGHVVAIEFDPELHRGLEGRYDNVELWLADAAKADLAARGPYDAIVANLPYQISAPITFAFMDLLQKHPWSRAVLMVQKEFGDRMGVSDAKSDTGRLAIQLTRKCLVEKVRLVPPGAFNPPPRVDSMVVKLTPRDDVPAVPDEAKWQRLLTLAFGQRRKKLRNNLGGLGLPKDRLDSALGDLADKRAEDLDVDDFVALAHRLEA